MFRRSNIIRITTLKDIKFFIPKPLSFLQEKPIYNYTQKSNYVDVKMKWKKDSYYDSIETIYKSQQLKPIISLKNCITEQPEGCIPISAVSKRGLVLDVPVKKVIKFLRHYPSIFEEFTGPQYNLPWFKLTPEAIELHKEELAVYENHRVDILERLKKFILMSQDKKLPWKVIRGMQWYLGLPDKFLKDPESNLDSSFKVVEMEDGLWGLSVETYEKKFSLLQKDVVKRGGEYLEGSSPPLAIPLYPSKGLRLKRKISYWLDEFQRLPYVSPYEDFQHLNRSSDVYEKRVVGVFHELLGLFVDHSAERKKLFCLRPYLGLPQKFYKAFERHQHIFYLSLKNKTCTVILKEAYNDDSTMEIHPLLYVREKYIRLMKKSDIILKRRRQNNQTAEHGKLNLDVDTFCEVEDKEIPMSAL